MEIVTALFIGLMGSLGHCVGMCSAVVLLIERHPAVQAQRLSWMLVHLGRLTTYVVLGGLAGAAGKTLGSVFLSLRPLQGVLSIGFAILAFYLAASIVGLVPAFDRLLPGLTQKWGQMFRRLASPGTPQAGFLPGAVQAYAAGLIWGLLPCGMVFSALLLAAAAASAGLGMVILAVFGAATVPSLLGVRWLAGQRGWSARQPAWTLAGRHTAAALMTLTSMQLVLRGMAAWGWVGHLMLGPVMLW